MKNTFLNKLKASYATNSAYQKLKIELSDLNELSLTGSGYCIIIMLRGLGQISL
jgi:hypothetical protein